MTAMKVVALLAGGVFVAAAVGGGVLWYRRRKQQKEESKRPQRVQPRPTPSKPPADRRARGHIEDLEGLDAELRELLETEFPSGWPPDETTIDNLEKDDVIVFAVESEPVGPYENTREELLNAKVLSVETSVVRARIFGEVRHAEHFGSYAGHGFRIGDLVEVPRDKVLVAARLTDAVLAWLDQLD